MNKKIAIIDYGMGNLHSVKKAFEHIGADSFFTRAPVDLRHVTHIILPGVGAFRDAIAALESTGFSSEIVSRARAGVPLLGICIGMQLLFDVSEEDGMHSGLALLNGRVTRLNTSLKVPHIGWNTLETRASSPLFTGIQEPVCAYFVHSYAVHDEDQPFVAATTHYGCAFVSAVAQDNVCGFQYHPEKSDLAGLKMLDNFVQHYS